MSKLSILVHKTRPLSFLGESQQIVEWWALSFFILQETRIVIFYITWLLIQVRNLLHLFILSGIGMTYPAITGEELGFLEIQFLLIRSNLNLVEFVSMISSVIDFWLVQIINLFETNIPAASLLLDRGFWNYLDLKLLVYFLPRSFSLFTIFWIHNFFILSTL
jgi:hypothetical protein